MAHRLNWRMILEKDPQSSPQSSRVGLRPRRTTAQGISQRNVSSPNPRNIARQPYDAVIRPPASVPAAGPVASAAPTPALAKPGRWGGTCRAIILGLPGNATLSPIPGSPRRQRSDTNPPTKLVSRVLAAQSATPAP